jgi:hypothetical protein
MCKLIGFAPSQPQTLDNMEALIFALIATLKGYTQHETFIPEPAKFQPFDLRAR